MPWLDSQLIEVQNRRQLLSHRPLTRVSGWSSVCVAVLFAFHLNYLPVHVATELHVGQVFASLTHLVFHGHHHSEEQSEKQSETDHHLPHPASDHALDLALRTQLAAGPSLLFLPPVEFSLPVRECSALPSAPLRERRQPPAAFPPDPLRPRAPPLV